MSNKMIKGAVAGATGIALLMGGFGTYALWSDSESMAGGTVTSGELDVTAKTVAWTDASNATWNTATDLVVPGDVVSRKQSFDFVGTGKNLTGTITFTPGSETDGPGTYAAFGNALDIDMTVDGDDVSPGGTPWCWEFSAPLSGTKTVATVVDFTFNDVNNQVAQAARTTLGSSTIAITQGATCS